VLGDSDMMHQITAQQAIQRFPNARIALSRNSTFLKKFLGMISTRIYAPDKGGLPIPPIRRFLDPQDKRLPQMELGLGLWEGEHAKFYQRSVLKANNRALIDKLNTQRVLIYIDPQTHTPTAIYSNALSFWWSGDVLHLNNGAKIDNGIYYNASGEKVKLQYPRQVFTRWYGFAYTFNNCDIYQPEF